MKKGLDTMKLFLEIVFILMLIGVFNALSGCASLPQPSVLDSASSNTQIIMKTIRSTNWISSLLMIGFVMGLIAAFGLDFKQLGLVTSGACIAGLFLSAAMSNLWFYIGAGLVVFASILIVIAGLVWKHKAIVEIVTGVEELKQGGDPKEDSKLLSASQSKHTQLMVQEVKAKLKVGGKI